MHSMVLVQKFCPSDCLSQSSGIVSKWQWLKVGYHWHYFADSARCLRHIFVFRTKPHTKIPIGSPCFDRNHSVKVAFSAGDLTDVRPSVVIIDASLSFTSRRHCGGHSPTLVYLRSPEGATIRRDAGVNLLLWAGGGLTGIVSNGWGRHITYVYTWNSWVKQFFKCNVIIR